MNCHLEIRYTAKLHHVTGRFLVNSCDYSGQNVIVIHQENDQKNLSCEPTNLKNGPIETSVFLG